MSSNRCNKVLRLQMQTTWCARDWVLQPVGWSVCSLPDQWPRNGRWAPVLDTGPRETISNGDHLHLHCKLYLHTKKCWSEHTAYSTDLIRVESINRLNKLPTRSGTMINCPLVEHCTKQHNKPLESNNRKCATFNASTDTEMMYRLGRLVFYTLDVKTDL